MLESPLPPRRYTLEDYPNLDPGAIGKVIPIGFGTLLNLAPTEINTATDTYKLLDQAIEEITEIRSAAKSPLISGLDYSENLAAAEFSLLKPVYLSPATTYYVAIEADYPQSGTNYVSLKRNNNQYAYGTSYSIDSGDSWTPDVDDYDLLFVCYGKQSGTAEEEVLATNTAPDSTTEIGVKDTEPTKKVGFSFLPAVSAYLTRVVVYITKHGSTTGYSMRATLYSDISGTQVGPDGSWQLISLMSTHSNFEFPERNEDDNLDCDIKAPDPEMDQCGEILENVIETVLERAPGLLDASSLANLEADKTEVLKIFLDDETTFGDFVGKLEAGQFWKLVPLQNGTYGTIVYESGEPGNTPHFRDYDFLSFRSEIDSSEIVKIVNILYDEDERDGGFLTRTASSDLAKFFYHVDKSLEVETFLVSGTDGDALASEYLSRYEVPISRIIFEVHGWGLDLVPGRDKVKITKTRIGYAGGSLAAVLFRVTKLVKRPDSNTVEITACRWGDATT